MRIEYPKWVRIRPREPGVSRDPESKSEKKIFRVLVPPMVINRYRNLISRLLGEKLCRSVTNVLLTPVLKCISNLGRMRVRNKME
jgi:hypothetical protein